MTKFLQIPTLHQATQLMDEAEKLNPGPWVQHSIYAAQAAEAIASRHPDLNPSRAYILGYLHDIGRRAGVTDMRHSVDGYNYLMGINFDDAARICITHSFPIKAMTVGEREWDGSAEEFIFVKDFLFNIEYTAYDKLIQLCDTITLPGGFCIIEKRFVDVALRRGITEFTLAKWKAFLSLKDEFEQIIGCSIYEVLPGEILN